MKTSEIHALLEVNWVQISFTSPVKLDKGKSGIQKVQDAENCSS